MTDSRARCPYARLGVAFYRTRFTYWTLQRDAGIPIWRKPRNCADAKYLAVVWARRSYASRLQTEHYWSELRRRTLTEGDWHHAVAEAQKVYPGTSGWLLSCSAAEGGHGRWVSYAGLYSPAYAAANYVVGGWMQFKYPTFTGMFRNALSDVRRKGFLVPSGLEPDLAGWQSPLAQALAAGWARATGNDHHHWSASFSRGC